MVSADLRDILLSGLVSECCACLRHLIKPSRLVIFSNVLVQVLQELLLVHE